MAVASRRQRPRSTSAAAARAEGSIAVICLLAADRAGHEAASGRVGITGLWAGPRRIRKRRRLGPCRATGGMAVAVGKQGKEHHHGQAGHDGAALGRGGGAGAERGLAALSLAGLACRAVGGGGGWRLPATDPGVRPQPNADYDAWVAAFRFARAGRRASPADTLGPGVFAARSFLPGVVERKDLRNQTAVPPLSRGLPGARRLGGGCQARAVAGSRRSAGHWRPSRESSGVGADVSRGDLGARRRGLARGSARSRCI